MPHSWQSELLTIGRSSRDPDSVIDGPYNSPGSWQQIYELYRTAPVFYFHGLHSEETLVRNTLQPRLIYRRETNSLVSISSPRVVYMHGSSELQTRMFEHMRFIHDRVNDYSSYDMPCWHKPASDEKKARRAVNRAAKHGDRTARMQRDAARKAQQHRARRH